MNCPRCRSYMDADYDIDYDQIIYYCGHCDYATRREINNGCLDAWLDDWAVGA